MYIIIVSASADRKNFKKSMLHFTLYNNSISFSFKQFYGSHLLLDSVKLKKIMQKTPECMTNDMISKGGFPIEIETQISKLITYS